MGADEIINVVSSVGFPVLVSVYLLTRFSTTIEKLTLEITRLSASIDKLDEFIAHRPR